MGLPGFVASRLVLGADASTGMLERLLGVIGALVEDRGGLAGFPGLTA